MQSKVKLKKGVIGGTTVRKTLQTREDADIQSIVRSIDAARLLAAKLPASVPTRIKLAASVTTLSAQLAATMSITCQSSRASTLARLKSDSQALLANLEKVMKPR